MSENRPLTEADLDFLVTKQDYERLKKGVVKQLRLIKEEIADLWKKLNDDFEAESQLADEAVDKAERANRAVRRLEKRVKELEAEFEDG